MSTAASFTGETDGGQTRPDSAGASGQAGQTGDIYASIGPITGGLRLGDIGSGDQIVVGIGSRRGVGIRDVRMAMGEALAAAGVRARDVVSIVTVDAKQTEDALLELAELLNVPLRALPAELLAEQAVPNPSATAERLVGVPSVAEAAVLATGADLLHPKYASRGVTVAVGRLPTGLPLPVVDLAEGYYNTSDLAHHGDAETAPGLINLAVNVHGQAPEWLRQRLREAVDDLAAYPNPERATAAVAARHGRPVDQVLLTAGAAEAFTLLARALAPNRAVVIHPQFTEPEAALNIAGHSVQRVVLEAPFHLDPRQVPDDADLVIVGNPTNPTSVLHPAQRLMALARPGRVLVVDEAFMDAVPGEAQSLAGTPSQPALPVPGLVVVRSLTKTWGLAGLRIGYLLGDPELLAACRMTQPLWSVGSLGLEAAIACSSPEAVAEAARMAEQAIEDRTYLLTQLAGIPDVQVGEPAYGPFLLIKVFGPDPAGVHARLRADGWAVRRADTFPGLGPGWLRTAVRDKQISDAFVLALDRAVRGEGPLDRDVPLPPMPTTTETGGDVPRHRQGS
jgi:histidinol-phosphate aminotransferase